MGWLTHENRLACTLDLTKLERWRKRERAKIRAKEEKEISSRPVRAIYFDGKKMATLFKKKGKSGRSFQGNEIQDHYVMVEEPDSVFIGHVVPYSGHGISIAVAIFRYLVARGWKKELIILGADGMNTIVGYKNGVIAYLEMLLGHPVHWEICLLHGNELPLRALFGHYDGKTSGPNSFKGPLGKSLEGDLTQPSTVHFARIKNNDFPQLPEEEACDLSSD